MQTLIDIWTFINIIAFLGTVVTAITDNINFSFVNPIVIYRSIPVNWFGTLLLTIILNILLPSIAIPYWIYKICTVGRKKDEVNNSG